MWIKKTVIRIKECWIVKKAVHGIAWAPCINLMQLNSAWKIECTLMSMYVSCMQKLFDIHKKMCMQIISQLKLFPS